MMKQGHKHSSFETWQLIKRSFSFDVKKMALISLLISLTIILNVFARFIITIPIFGIMRVSISTVFLITMGFVINPFIGFIVGFITDIISFFIGSVGVFHIGFSISSGLIVFITSWFALLFKNKKSYIETLQVIGGMILVFVFTLFLLFDNSLGIELLIRSIVAIVISIILLGSFLLILRKKTGPFVNIILIVLVSSLVSSVLNSIWLNQLYNIEYSLLLWPRVFKSFTFDLIIFSSLVYPIKVICDKKNIYWFDIKWKKDEKNVL